MAPVLVDSNVILDIATEDEQWMEWSAEALARYGESSAPTSGRRTAIAAI